jgi:hypothetical protein
MLISCKQQLLAEGRDKVLNMDIANFFAVGECVSIQMGLNPFMINQSFGVFGI